MILAREVVDIALNPCGLHESEGRFHGLLARMNKDHYLVALRDKLRYFLKYYPVKVST